MRLEKVTKKPYYSPSQRSRVTITKEQVIAYGALLDCIYDDTGTALGFQPIYAENDLENLTQTYGLTLEKELDWNTTEVKEWKETKKEKIAKKKLSLEEMKDIIKNHVV